MKAKKILAIILAIVAITSLFSGCSDKNNEGENTTKTVEASTKKIDISTDGAEKIELEKIEVSQTESFSRFRRESDGTVWTVTATYDTVNETVSEIAITVEIPKSSRKYDSTVAKYETAKADLDKLNDKNISASFGEAENGTSVKMLFKALNEADRAPRVACIEGILDIEADEDYTFRLEGLDIGLTLRAFKDV